MSSEGVRVQLFHPGPCLKLILKVAACFKNCPLTVNHPFSSLSAVVFCAHDWVPPTGHWAATNKKRYFGTKFYCGLDLTERCIFWVTFTLRADQLLVCQKPVQWPRLRKDCCIARLYAGGESKLLNSRLTFRMESAPVQSSRFAA